MLSSHPEEPQSVAQSLAATRAQLADVSAACGRAAPPRLVAVSKTTPLELLREAEASGGDADALAERAMLVFSFLGHACAHGAADALPSLP